ncbi:uncharacterized protein KIAA1614 homolog isoform X2 [Varanus komodoensis]|uniref:uncharacterized protein KIAA1614 homolog isoform X2 n=1 Tax=Varanus komodoensis TaxID=61221 RepID=UPI001CF7CFF2|nr:uncharacterized protein KIAA1614 homolog isoform X2 [Varanus komodoensis]
MEGDLPAERRKAMKDLRQCVRNHPRLRQAPESSGDVSRDGLSGPAWVPVRPSGDTGQSISVLESKVKALKERRSAAYRQAAAAAAQEQVSPRKAKACKGKLLVEPAAQDAVVEPQAQIRTYLTDVLLDSTDYPTRREEEPQEAILGSPSACDFEALKGSRAAEEPGGLDWASPEELQGLPPRDVLDRKGPLGSTAKRTPQNGLYGASSLKDLSFLQRYFEEAHGGEEEHLLLARDFESGSFAHKKDPCGVTATRRLWRAESWDSLGSGGSNASSLSLAEKVERNRSVLQEILSASQLISRSSRELQALHCHKKKTAGHGHDGPSNEILANDIDWDSGVSLQDSEGYRAFVPKQELELSPRHEQAKQLLQRARMKARTNPLRASHHILSPAPQERRDACGLSAADARNFARKDGDAHTSGNLSDSSSGESSCGQQRKRGSSPSRVRFEDESARDAEVRYLERLQQRQRRVLDSVLLSLGRGPLASKPDLSNYINGDPQHRENGISKAGWEQPSIGRGAGTLAPPRNGGCSEKGKAAVISEAGKCSACGAYISNWAAGGKPDTGVGQTGNDAYPACGTLHEGTDLGRADEDRELGTSREDSRTRTAAPKVTPLWILPSRQRVCTERIRETYIGEVTCVDEVDSALDSATDTSDSCRTDSEEAGVGSRPPVVKRQGHGGPGPPEKEARNKRAEGSRHREPSRIRANGEEACDGTPGTHSAGHGSSKGACAAWGRAGHVAPNTAEAFPGRSRPSDLRPPGETEGHAKVPKAPLREPSCTAHMQEVPSHLALGGGADSVERRRKEDSCHTDRPANGASPRQPAKQVAATRSLMDRVPMPPATRKARSSPVPYRRAVLAGSCKLSHRDLGQKEPALGPSAHSGSPSSFHPASAPELEEQSGPQSPKVLSKRQLLALSTNNCNNTQSKCHLQTPGTAAVRGPEEQLRSGLKTAGSQGPASSAHVSPSNGASMAASLPSSTSAQSSSREAPATEAQKTTPVQAATIQRKPLDINPEPKKKPLAKKGASSSSSASGLKKFFTTLSQNTKQRLGRFRCYSMEQICAPESGAAVPAEEPGPGPADSPKMKKAPSLQSLRLVAPFCQPRKASSVQSLNSLLGKADRSSLYLLGEPGDAEAASHRKARAQHRRSLSVEDIGSPNLARTVGRVVEVFPDGTSQLELQRSPQGNFGFRVSSGNGRPDTGLYVQEMADASTAKLYAGLLRVGDEVLEVNGAKVAGLGLAKINELLLRADTLSMRVLRQRPLRR